LLLLFHWAGGLQQVAQIWVTPRFLAPCKRAAPALTSTGLVGGMRCRSMESPMPLVTLKSASIWAAVQPDAQALEAPKPRMFWFKVPASMVAGPAKTGRKDKAREPKARTTASKGAGKVAFAKERFLDGSISGPVTVPCSFLRIRPLGELKRLSGNGIKKAP